MGFRMTQGWVNDEKDLIFSWTVSLNLIKGAHMKIQFNILYSITFLLSDDH